jgi:mannose-6-phosphate isomerase-like protein (cupin superfamily)
MMAMTDALKDVIAGIGALRRDYEHRRAAAGDALSAELGTVLALLDRVDFTRPDEDEFRPSGHGVTRHLLGELPSRNGTVADVLGAFRPLFAALPWRYGYEPRADMPGLDNAMAWAEFVGPLAPFRSDKVCLGITAIGPNTRYHEHCHPAVESYYVLSGTARWTAAGVTHEREPGWFTLHPSNIVHAMETGDEPLVAAYTWTGDVETPSSFAGEAAPVPLHQPDR